MVMQVLSPCMITLQGMKRSVENEFMNLCVKITTDIEMFTRFQKDFEIFLTDHSTNP
jgi:hypothetical protein